MTIESEATGLLRALARLDEVLRRAVAAAREAYASAGSMPLLPGLYVDHAEVERLLGREPGASLLGEEPQADAVADSDPRLAWLQHAFGLSPFDMQVIVIAIAPEIDLRYERIYSYLQDDVTRKRPTVDLALHLLSPTAETRLVDRAAFATDAALIRNELVRLVPPDGTSEPPLLAHALKVDDQVVRLLLAGNELDRRLGGIAELVEAGREDDEDLLPDDAGERLARLVTHSRSSRHALRLYFQGTGRASRRRAAEALAARVGMRLLVVDLVDLPTQRLEVERTLRLLFREAWLQHAILLLDGVDRLDTPGPGETRTFDQLAAFESDEADIVILGGERLWVPVARGLTGMLTVPIPVPGFDGRLDAWRRRLADIGVPIGSANLAALAERFRLTADQIADAVTTADRRAAWRVAGRDPRRSTIRTTAYTFQRRSPSTTCSPPRGSSRAASSAAMPSRSDPSSVGLTSCCHRRPMVSSATCARGSATANVCSATGASSAASRYGKGVNALFSGPSGTGKTMAAEIIARRARPRPVQDRPLGVVSKYIGETEKNLRAIFRAAAGRERASCCSTRRTRCSASAPRSATRTTATRTSRSRYLLQQMEQYEGIAILATNLRQNIDEAFIRRLQFVVEFPFPDEDDRAADLATRSSRPRRRATPTIDFALLGREFRLAGGNIKNAVLAAAFIAAAEGAPIGMDHIQRATRRELQKMGRVVGKEAGPSEAT